MFENIKREGYVVFFSSFENTIKKVFLKISILKFSIAWLLLAPIEGFGL